MSPMSWYAGSQLRMTSSRECRKVSAIARTFARRFPCVTTTPFGLLVDQLIGMQEVVLKSLEKNFRSILGLSGASILGDGRVSLILDLDAVIDMVARQPARHRE